MLEPEEVALLQAELWRRGEAWRFLADDGQQEWVRLFDEADGDVVLCVSRQRGKSFLVLLYAVCLAIRQPGSVIRYAAKTKMSAQSIVEPNLALILETCPPDLRPAPDGQRGMLHFPNGSTFVWAGTDAETFDRLRGPRSHLILLDEAAFFQDLERVEAALLPSLQTTGGKAIYLSTPPDQPAHPFVARYRAALGTGRGIHGTIEDNPRLGKAGVERVLRREAERLGMTLDEFRKSTYCRREFYAEIVTEESRAAVPGWTQERAAQLVREVERPKFFDAYVSVDLGFGDPHAVLFGYLDFVNSRLVIEDELELRNANTKALAEAIKQKESVLWGSSAWNGTLRGAASVDNLPEWVAKAKAEDCPPQPWMRYGDNDPLALADLSSLYGVAVVPTAKDEKHLQADRLDVLVRQARVVIHPRCKRTIQQLFTTIWNKQRTEWERTGMDHGDLVDCLIYMTRNISWNRDPRPLHYGVDLANVWIPPPPKTEDDVFGELFGRK